MKRETNTGRSSRAQRSSPQHRQQQQPRAWTAQQRASSWPRGATVGTALSLVGGVAVGAALMYLLDPQVGQKRRRAVRAAAAQAIDAAGETLGSTWEAVSDTAHDAALAAGEKAQHLAQSVSDSLPSASSARKGFRRAWHDASDAGSDWLSSARSRLPSLPSTRSLRRSNRYFTPRDQGFSTTSVGVTALGCLAAGLGAMWFFDPDRGRSRRAWIGQKATRILHETGDFMRRTGRHLRNKTRGYAHETRKAVGGLSANFAGSRLGNLAEDLAERVRFALGSLGLGSGDSIAVSCEGGCVTLTGRCAAEDVDSILSTTRNIQGVDSIRNNLEVRSYASGI